jgi:putative endonuclease
MSDKIKRGEEGERAAAEYLIGKGFEIVERNYRYRHSEIDLIVKQGQWLVFVEVKTRSSAVYGHPEDFVDEAKEAKILEGAEHFIFDRDWKGQVRYDIIAVSIKKTGGFEILHIEDAFY